MITLIAAKNYRSLRHISRALKPFQILVGPNASGKTTFLDVVEFMSDVMTEGVDEAIKRRSSNFQDLTFARHGGPIELAMECAIPEDVRAKLNGNGDFDTVRYELRLDLDEVKHGHVIDGERLVLVKSSEVLRPIEQRDLFPAELHEEAVYDKGFKGSGRNAPYRLVVSKKMDQQDNFKPERSNKKWVNSFKLGPKKSALANVPEDEGLFPVSTWFKEFLKSNVQHLMLDGKKLSQASPPGSPATYLPDGSNLPWVVERLKKDDPQAFNDWIDHVRTALRDLDRLTVNEIFDLRSKYLWLSYTSPMELPSWVVSDGTLRLLALTLIAYLSDFKGTYMIEEPENGIHPLAMETVFKSLSNVYHAQIMVATHSPVVLSMAEPDQLLCFAKLPDGATDIVAGENHPKLTDWRKGGDLSLLFASGILG